MRKILLGFFVTIFLILSSLGATSAVFSNSQETKDSGEDFKSTIDIAKETEELEDLTSNLQINMDNTWLGYNEELKGTHEEIFLTFEEPEIVETENYAHIIVPESNYFNPGSAPMVPKRTVTLTYPPGTSIVSVAVEPQNFNLVFVTKPVMPAYEPYPLVKGFTELANPDPIMDKTIYQTNEYYPSEWFTYSTGIGLHPESSEHVLFLVVQIYPTRYNPMGNEISYFTNAKLIIDIEEPAAQPQSRSGSGRAVTYDMVIISPNNFKNNDLLEFAQRKTATGINSIVISMSDITAETYFPTSTTYNRDQQEIIKYFIYNAIKEWDIKYVLLVGDHDQLPARRTHVDDSWPDANEASDLYFVDVFDSSNNFCDWNYDGDDKFGEYSNGNIDKADLYPDAHIGRFPVSTASEMKTLIDKTINYEYTAIGTDWFKTAILNGMDTFSGGTPEGEYLSDYIADHYLDDFTVIKLYETDNTLSTQAIKTNFNNGAGFVSFSDHGTHGAWGGSEFRTSDIKSLTNGDKLAFVNFDACLTGEFDIGEDCIGEETILNPNGAGVAVVASSRVAYGSWGASHINTASGYFNVRLYHNFDQTSQVAGEMVTNSKMDYLRNVGAGGSVNFKTIIEYLYFGDPSLLLGGLPTAIFNIKCDNNKSSVNPGESYVYNLEVENTDIITRQIKLSLSNIPSGWQATLSEKTLFLDSNQKEDITLTVTAPNNAIADFAARINVNAQLANIQRTLSLETKTTVKRIYGFDILANDHTNTSGSVLPGKKINFTFQVYNHGNGEDSISLSLDSELEESYSWISTFEPSPVIIAPFSEYDVKLVLEVPEKTIAKDYDLAIRAKLLGTGKTKSLDLIITVDRVFGMNLSCANPSITTDPGINNTFRLTLENKGNHLETFLFTTPNIPVGWKMFYQTTDTINDTLAVEPFSSLKVNAVLNIPTGTLVGDYNFTLMAQCIDIEYVIVSNVELNVIVNRVYGILLTSQSTEIVSNPGERHFRYLEVYNLGNDLDSADIEIISYPDNWNVILDSQYNVLLPANGKRTLGFSITSHEQEIVGTYNINLRAILEGDGSISDLRLKMKINRIYDLNVTHIEPIANLTSGVKSTLPITVSNLGNDKDTITLRIADQIPYCSVSLKDQDPIVLRAYGSKNIDLSVTPDKNIYAGMKSIPIIATLKSTGENYTFEIPFNINQYCGVELSANKKQITTQPGTEIKYDISIQNTGNGEDTFIIMIDDIPQQWNVNFPKRDSITVQPFKSTNRSLFLNIPSDEPYHDVKINIRIKSTVDDSVNSAIQLTTSIEEDEMTVLGVKVETFGISIVIIIVIIILISAVLIRGRRKKHQTKKDNAIIYDGTGGNYSIGSDGSRVAWEETAESHAPQYNPPTPAANGQLFEIQVQRPTTYRSQTYISPTSAEYPAALSSGNIQGVPYYDAQMIPPEPDELSFKAPSTQAELQQAQLPPATEEEPEMPRLVEYDDTEYLANEDQEVLKQLDAELAAEAASGDSLPDDSITNGTVGSEAQEENNYMEYHENDEFSISFKRPEKQNENPD
jgi:uncharacterized membrane protein